MLLWQPDDTFEELKLQAVEQALCWFNWNRTRTAKALGICPRTMRGYVKKMKLSGIEIKDNPRGSYKKPPPGGYKQVISKYGY